MKVKELLNLLKTMPKESQIKVVSPSIKVVDKKVKYHIIEDLTQIDGQVLLFCKEEKKKKAYEVHWICNSMNQDNVHGIFPTLEEAQDSVRDWWKKHDFKPYYVRQWTQDNVTIWDYGSHIWFYHFVEVEVDNNAD